MIVATQKKRENIAEYLLYMWQIEDLIRAYGLNLDAITTHIIGQYCVEEPQRADIVAWYGYLIEMMQREEVVAGGHLQINKNVIIELTDIHHRLLNSPKNPFYGAAFFKSLPYIVELRARAGEKAVGELETCFEALYGVAVLRMQGKEISSQTLAALQQISSFVALLADCYKRDRAGELEY